jgi:hypothetical protein
MCGSVSAADMPIADACCRLICRGAPFSQLAANAAAIVVVAVSSLERLITFALHRDGGAPRAICGVAALVRRTAS